MVFRASKELHRVEKIFIGKSFRFVNKKAALFTNLFNSPESEAEQVVPDDRPPKKSPSRNCARKNRFLALGVDEAQ